MNAWTVLPALVRSELQQNAVFELFDSALHRVEKLALSPKATSAAGKDALDANILHVSCDIVAALRLIAAVEVAHKVSTGAEATGGSGGGAWHEGVEERFNKTRVSVPRCCLVCVCVCVCVPCTQQACITRVAWLVFV